MKGLIVIILFISSNIITFSQVRLALTNEYTVDYTIALVYDTLFKLKGDEWMKQNIVDPIIKGNSSKLQNVMIVYLDGSISFYPLKIDTSQELISTLNDVASCLEKKHAIIYKWDDLFNLSNVNIVTESALPFYRKNFILDHRAAKEYFDNQSIPDLQQILIAPMYQDIPIFDRISFFLPSTLIYNYSCNPEIEESEITIIDYLKQEFDKILSQPIKSTLDYGITNEDFWSNNNTTENDSENTIKD